MLQVILFQFKSIIINKANKPVSTSTQGNVYVYIYVNWDKVVLGIKSWWLGNGEIHPLLEARDV